jgi:hypothetical protein
MIYEDNELDEDATEAIIDLAVDVLVAGAPYDGAIRIIELEGEEEGGDQDVMILVASGAYVPGLRKALDRLQDLLTFTPGNE